MRLAQVDADDALLSDIKNEWHEDEIIDQCVDNLTVWYMCF